MHSLRCPSSGMAMTRRASHSVRIKNLQQGGTERQILRMMKSLDPQAFDTALCTLSPEIHYKMRHLASHDTRLTQGVRRRLRRANPQ